MASPPCSHSVTGTVKNPSVAEKTVHLTKLAESQPGNLTLYAAELSIPGSFDNAIKGATYM